MISELYVILAGFLFLLIVYVNGRKNTKGQPIYPPGPYGFPILGYIPFLHGRNPIKILNQLKEKYGKVFSLTLGKFNVVVINDYKLINEAYKEDVFSGRPPFEVNMIRNHGKKRAIIFSDGKTWAEQRRFAVRNLRVFGLGKQTMEGLLNFEAQELIGFFEDNVGKAVDVRNKFNASVLNSLWFICTGNRFEKDDPNFNFIIENFINQLQKTETGGVAFFFPWILKSGIIPKYWNMFLNIRDRLQGIMQDTIDEHKKTFNPNETRDFVDAYLAHIHKTEDPDSSFYNGEGELNLRLMLVDFFLAGAETTSNTLQWAMLYMILWPDIQRKVQEEIDQVIGQRAPSLEDRPNMIYCEATIYEIHRYCSLIPFNIYHRATADTTLGNFRIPKDTVLMANIQDAHFDKEYWGDPETFRPERWIKEGKIVKHAAFMPFSTGKRLCVGSALANDSLFIFFLGIMQKFTLEKDPACTSPLSLEYNASSLVISPKPYKALVKHRIVN